ncbi:ubiquinol oxidase subunit II [Ralstonia pseudosolanacearum]
MLKPTALPADNPPQGRLAAPPSPIPPRLVALALGALASLLLSGCNLELLSPKGSIGEQEKSLILVALFVMLLVVIPVIVLTLWFAWRYRETNTRAAYAPTWAHSTPIEIVVWGIPCLIVVFLGVLIWNTTHKLDPYRPLASQVEPVEVEVIALNWKWLFIYPQYGVASLNQLAIPVGTPINFRLTAESMMNAFFIPQLGSMVYTMAGMQTQLHLIADTPGVYLGQSAAYSGAGFSDMHFKTLATSREAFDAWVRSAKASANTLDFKTYRGLERPSSRDAVTLFSAVAPKLFDRVIDKYMLANGQVCRADGPESLQAFQPIPSASIGRVEQ